MPKSEADLGVASGKLFKIGVRLLDFRKAHKCNAIKFSDIVKTGDAKTRG